MTGGLLSAADRIDGLVSRLCRWAIILSGIVLTVVMTANVVARYTFASGGFDFAQELPTLIFPWFIIAGIVLAAQLGSHMAVEWIYGKVDEPGKVKVFLLANLITLASFLVLARQALIVADIAGIEHSPVLGLPNSIGYYSIATGGLLVAIVTATAVLRVAVNGWAARPAADTQEMPL
ncbi:C4-dicarboxylate ABC transporter permease [Pararhizobium polonicum]|uniref:TRAP transporter small permease protein n=1 Tax=Pararhizobium polonicum TaxID=1612624 RepID=A0A1C7P035_9HYPH|nr:TRAP transporter small permease subunit [Pararhizobium polonicum]OBZ94607.1 C4-dicarboxylate ABC transporter permease [Pararhizobium polonicum]